MSDNDSNSAFPHAVKGDVLVVLSHGRRYTLQSSILRRGSPYFASCLTEHNTQVAAKSKKDGSGVRWRFEMVAHPSSDEGGELQLIPLDARGNIMPNADRPPMDTLGSQIHRPVYDHYHRVLASLHFMPFELDEQDLNALLRDILGLTEVAEYLGCTSIIRRSINVSLLNQGQDLYRAIATNPSAWLVLSMRVQSEHVFKEAVIHLVGRWNQIPAARKQDEEFIPAVGREICQRKHDELDEMKQRIEHKILKFYPPELCRDVDDGPDTYNRQSYSSDVFGWLAIGLFKHWFSACLASDRHRHSADGGYWLYTSIAEGGDAYLGLSERNAFHRRFPLTVKGTAVFDRWIKGIKESVSPLVQPLLKNESKFVPDAEDPKCQYLTSTQVRKEDCPWIKESKKRRRDTKTDNGGEECENAGKAPADEEYESEYFVGDLREAAQASDSQSD